MNIKEARIILLCNNVVEVIFAQSKGALSEDLYNEEDGFDLNELKKQAIEIVLAELDKKDKIIDKMADEIYDLGQKQDERNDNITIWVNKEHILNYFTKTEGDK